MRHPKIFEKVYIITETFGFGSGRDDKSLYQCQTLYSAKTNEKLVVNFGRLIFLSHDGKFVTDAQLADALDEKLWDNVEQKPLPKVVLDTIAHFDCIKNEGHRLEHLADK